MSHHTTIKRTSKKELQSGAFPIPEIVSSSSNVETSVIAGEVIGSPRLVMIEDGEALLFDPTVEANMYKIAGLSRHAAIEGAALNVILVGALDTGGGVVQDNIYYAGPNGTMITSAPTTGIVLRIGIAKNNDILIVNFSTPFFLI